MFDNWDWDEFAGTVFGIVFGTIFVGLFLVVVGMIVYLAWTSGFGGFVLGFVALIGLAAIIATIVQVVGRRW